jgi:hypothetical protein
MYIYIHTHIYTCIYHVYVCIYMHDLYVWPVCMYICTNLHICMHTGQFTCIHTRSAVARKITKGTKDRIMTVHQSANVISSVLAIT